MATGGGSEDQKCILCSVFVTRGNQRRNLDSPASRHVVDLLRKMLQEFLHHEPLVFPQARNSFLCKPCFRMAEKLIQLTENTQELKNSLEGKLRSLFGESIESRLGSPSNSPQSEVPMDKVSTPRRTRRQRRRNLVDTPTRSAINSLQQSTASPLVAVVEKSVHKGAKIKCLPKSLKTLGRSIGRKRKSSIALQCLKNKSIRSHILTYLGKDIQKELTVLCSMKSDELSLLRGRTSQELAVFSWVTFETEIKNRAPTFYAFLNMCVQVKRRRRKGRKDRKIPSLSSVLSVCACVFLHHKNQQMNMLQRLISLILHRGGAGKQVYMRLQRLHLCLSHQQTNDYLDKLGEGFDTEVNNWRDTILAAMTADEAVSVGDTESVRSTELDKSSVERDNLITSDPDSHKSDPETSDVHSHNSSNSSIISPPEFSPLSSGYPSQSSTDTSSTSSPDIDAFLSPSSPPSMGAMKTFKIVGDNIDKEIKPNHMRIDHQTRSLHYFHAYAVQDRLNLDDYEDNPSLPDIPANFDSLLPTSEDEIAIRNNMSLLITRVLGKHLAFFKQYGKGIERHIRHEHYEEMSRKSNVVPLGIILKSEQKVEDMIEILIHLQQYCPTLSTTEEVQLSGEDDPISVIVDNFHHTLLGGDQMTAARTRSSQRARNNSNRGKDRLEGMQPVVEDWHAKVCLLGVIFRRLYTCSSGIDSGTMYHLRNLINRRNVVKDPSSNVTACEEFFLHVVETHIIAACMTVFGMVTVDDSPSSELFPEESDALKRRQLMLNGVKVVMDKYVELSMKPDDEEGEVQERDCVLEYACDVLCLGLFYMEFVDAIREGDGKRILCCWKYLLLIFKSSGRTNYSIEAFTLLAQYNFLFSERMRMQLLWSRTVNVHGRPGTNIPCDLHNEHLNRECKGSISGLGANVTDRAIKRIGRSLRSTFEILQSFDHVNGVPAQSGHHSVRSASSDLKKMLEKLLEINIFTHVPSRKHSNFPKFERNIIKNLSKMKLTPWLQERFQRLIVYK